MNLEGVLEGLLYIEGDEGLTIKDISRILKISEEDAKKLIISLKNKYENIDRGLRIKYLGNAFKLSTKEEHISYFQQLLDTETGNALSQQALETLAIIAYNEPITRVKIDELRGVDTSYQLRKLIAKGFIKECGKANLPGRPTLYKTTSLFLDYFGMSTIEDLPKIETEEEIDNEQDLFISNYKEI